MAWIEFHPTRIKRLQKFDLFRKDLSLSVNEALGVLGSLWGEVMDLAESGDITGWTPEYVTERAGLTLNPERVWNALVAHKWIDIKEGRVLVHDWLDCAGRYLTVKYAGKQRAKLVEIWRVHGRVYGAKQEPSENQPTTNQTPMEAQERKGKEGKGEEGRGGAGEKPFDPADLPKPVRGAQSHAVLVAVRKGLGNELYDWVSGSTRATRPNDEIVVIAEVDRMVRVFGLDRVVKELTALGGAFVSVSYIQANRNLAKANPEKTLPATPRKQYGDEEKDYTGVLNVLDD